MNAPLRVPRLPRPALACALALLAACGGGRPAAPPALPVPVVRTAVIYDDDAGGMRDSVRLVVRDRGALETLWRTATSGHASPPPLPAVDFGREMVLAVGAGRMTPDDRIRVDSVGVRREAGGDGRVREALVVLVRTVRGCQAYRAAAWPVQMVRVRRHDGPVVFVERRDRAEGCARE